VGWGGGGGGRGRDRSHAHSAAGRCRGCCCVVAAPPQRGWWTGPIDRRPQTAHPSPPGSARSLHAAAWPECVVHVPVCECECVGWCPPGVVCSALFSPCNLAARAHAHARPGTTEGAGSPNTGSGGRAGPRSSPFLPRKRTRGVGHQPSRVRHDLVQPRGQLLGQRN
jgi:hypothetical protein